MSMDTNGKIIWAKHSEVQQANLKAMGDAEIKDGERLPLAVKDMGSCEIYPQTIQHNPNGRYAYTHPGPLTGYSYFTNMSPSSLTRLEVNFFQYDICQSFMHFSVHQVCCGVWRWRVHHLYCHGFEEQELRLSAGVCLGT